MASRLTMRTLTTRAALGAAGIGLALLATPNAAADPEIPPADPAPPLAMVAPAPALPADGAPAAIPAAAGVPHLPTPDNLPPGTTAAPTEGRNLGYIRDLWHAVRTQDVTMTDALLLFAQRPMSSNAPLNQMSPHSDPLPAAPLPAGPVDAPAPVEAALPGAPLPAVVPAAEAPAPPVLPEMAAAPAG